MAEELCIISVPKKIREGGDYALRLNIEGPDAKWYLEAVGVADASHYMSDSEEEVEEAEEAEAAMAEKSDVGSSKNVDVNFEDSADENEVTEVKNSVKSDE